MATMRDLESMSIDEAIEAHAVLDAIEGAEAKLAPQPKFDW